MTSSLLQQLLDRCPSDSPSCSCLKAARSASIGLGSCSSEGKALVLDYPDAVEAGPAFSWEDPGLPALIQSIPSLAEVDEIEITVAGSTRMWIGLEEPAPPLNIRASRIPRKPLCEVYYGPELHCSYASINDEIRATRQHLDDVEAGLNEISESSKLFLEERLEYLERQSLVNSAAVLIESLESATSRFRDALASFGDRKRLAQCQLHDVAMSFQDLAPHLAPTVQALLADLERLPSRGKGT